MGTHYSGTADEARALNAFIALARAAESVQNRIHLRSPLITRAQLTVSQFGALECLFHLGPMNQKALGEKILCSRGNVTMVVNNLEKRGLLKRSPNQEDRRHKTVQLTRKGEALIRDYFPAHVKIVLEEMNRLSSDELEQLRALCRKVGRGERAAD